MKTILLCNTDSLAIPATLRLLQQNKLAAVVIPDRSEAYLKATFISNGIPETSIHITGKNNLKQFLENLITQSQAEVLFTLTFPWKLPDEILHLLPKGCWNFHFGLLPAYPGADPIFWQLKNGEKEGGVTVHKMTTAIDAGPWLLQEKVPLLPGESYGIHCERLGQVAETITDKLNQLLCQSQPELQPAPAIETTWFAKPEASSLTINWQQQSSTDIISLVNACNPKYGGAITHFRHMQIYLVEVMPLEITNPPQQVVPPGTIIHADITYGLIVACSDKRYIRINIIHLREGYLSGSKLATLGWQSGEQFS